MFLSISRLIEETVHAFNTHGGDISLLCLNHGDMGLGVF